MILAFPFVSPDVTPTQRADSLMWNESQKALAIADAIAMWAFEKSTVGDLPLDKAALCRDLGTHALRSTKPEWREAAVEHAIESCADALKQVRAAMMWSHSERVMVARMLVGVMLEAYQGITQGSVVLPADVYNRIAQGNK